MSMSGPVNKRNQEGGKEMQNKNSGFDRVWSGVGWGLFLILIGILIFADNVGWLHGGEGWLYFAVGLGAIFIIGFLVRYFGSQHNRWNAFGSLIIGIALVYIGTAFLYDFGDWWPLVFVPIGVAYLVKGILSHKPESYTP